MFKKIYLIIMLLPLMVFAKEYNLPNENLKINFPDDWTVFTKYNLDDNEDLFFLNLTKEYMENYLKENDSYIYAASEDYELEFFLKIDNKIKKIKDDYEITEYTDQDKHILKYYTLNNGKAYNFVIEKKIEYDNKDKEIINNIIDSVSFNKIENNKNVYLYILIGIIFLTIIGLFLFKKSI